MGKNKARNKSGGEKDPLLQQFELNEQQSGERHGNFWFVYDRDEALYRMLLDVESRAVTDLRSAGGKLREALEHFQRAVIGGHEDYLAEVNQINADRCHTETSTQADIVDYQKFFEKHSLLGVDAKAFRTVRLNTNPFHHLPKPEKGNTKPRTYKTLLEALVSMHDMLYRYYFPLTPKEKYPKYNEKNRPIGNYWPYNTVRTSDATACQKQLLCFRTDGISGKKAYCLIRIYRAADVSGSKKEDVIRDEKVLAGMWDDMETPRNIVRYSVMDVKYDGENAEQEEKRLLRYDFGSYPPCPLSAGMAALTEEEKFMILHGMANGVRELHERKIYHRNLQPGSVYILTDKSTGQRTVKLVGFEYSKLTGDATTVYASVRKLHNGKRAQADVEDIENYFSPAMLTALAMPEPPEWLDWAREDIYSLGCLFYLLTAGHPPGKNENVARELSRLNTGRDLEELIPRMLEPDPDKRPSIGEICAVTRELYELAKQ